MSHKNLVFIRDHRPSPDEFIQTCCGGDPQGFHLLRKFKVIILHSDHISLNPNHLSDDGDAFRWANMLIHLDSDCGEVTVF